jgi:FtsH-binding integral membrane protein
MNPNEMQNIWNSPRNNLPTEDQQRLADQFAWQMIRRRRFQSVWLINTFGWLTIITVLAIWNVAAGQTTPTQEWGLIPLLLVPWAFAIHFLRRYLKPVAPPTHGEVSIVDSLRAALASNRETQSHLKLVGVLYVITIPLLALAMRQLHAVGKVSERELTSMALFFGAVLLVCAIGIAVRYFARLQPQQKRLDALLAELADGAR